MPITRGLHPKAQWPGVHTWFGINYNFYPTEYTDLYDRETSSLAYEEMVQSTSFGLAQEKSENGGVSYATHSQGPVQRATHVVYALGYILTREEVDDNQYDKLSRSRAASLSQSMMQTKENVAANGYNRAFNSAFPYADGVELISTNNVNTTGGTWSNALSTGAALSELSIEDMCIQINNAQNDVGLRIKLMPKCIILPTQESFNVHRILNSSMQSGSANHDINAIRDMKVIMDGSKVNHYLTDTNNWFIRTDLREGGLKCFDRRAIEFTKDNEFNTENAFAKATERYSFTCGDKRAIYGSGPA